MTKKNLVNFFTYSLYRASLNVSFWFDLWDFQFLYEVVEFALKRFLQPFCSGREKRNWRENKLSKIFFLLFVFFESTSLLRHTHTQNSCRHELLLASDRVRFPVLFFRHFINVADFGWVEHLFVCLFVTDKEKGREFNKTIKWRSEEKNTTEEEFLKNRNSTVNKATNKKKAFWRNQRWGRSNSTFCF